ncbi:MAG TPA: hypothetical protein PK794_10375, partial [Armatimonadota bacterium]|nr:hypothetical protein [Armatimonadota bacterium]
SFGWLRHGYDVYLSSAVPFQIAMTGAALLAFGLLLTRLAFPTRRLLACLLLGAVAGGFPAYNWYEDSRIAGRRDAMDIFTAMESTDGAVWLEKAPGAHETPDLVVLRLTDYRRDTQTIRPFPRPLAPAALLDAGVALLLAQPRGAAAVTLLRWDAAADTVEEICAISAAKGLLASPRVRYYDPSINPLMHVSPDGAHALLLLPTWAGEGEDLWHVDLAGKRARLVRPAQWVIAETVSWTEDAAILSDNGEPLRVDLRAGTVAPLPVTGRER